MPEISFEQALKTGTGKGVEIGLLDTGIQALPSLASALGGHFLIVDEDRKLGVVERHSGEDRINHGTACADVIHRYAPDARLYDVQVMDYKAQNSKYKLAYGIRFATQQNWDLLNICIGTRVDFDQLQQITGDALDAGMILLSAIENDAAGIGFPAAYEGVISVEEDFFESPLSVRPGSRADICAHGIYVSALNAQGETEAFTGSSFACPHVTALAARVRQHFPEMGSVEFLERLLEHSTDCG